MRLLLGDGAPREIDEPDLAALYPWPQATAANASGAWVRAMMLQSLDGSPIGPDGRSRSISSPADMRVFRQTRRGADAVLIGAQTMRVERYKPFTADARLCIVSASLDLPWDEPVWSMSTQRPIVLTSAQADAPAIAAAGEHAEVVTLPATSADAIVGALTSRGLRRITCEGGPRLLAELVRAGLVDELDLAIAPLMTGGGQIGTGAPAAPASFRLEHLLEHDGFLFTRYVRDGVRV